MRCHHYARVHPRMRGVRVAKHDVSAFPAGTLSYAQVLLAYGFTQNQFAGVPNVMKERVQDWGLGSHLKTRVDFGGFIRRVAYIDNVFTYVTDGAIEIETDYQSSGNCTAETCTEIRDIVWRNLTANARGAGSLACYAARPCINITLDNVHVNASNGWGCKNVSSGTFVNVTPPGLAEACGLA